MFVIATFAVLAVFALMFVACRDLLFPPALLALVWGVAMLALVLAGDLFYPVTDEAAMVYLLGTCAFAAGGLFSLPVGSRMPRRTIERTPLERQSTRRFLDVLLPVLILAVPLYWRAVNSVIGDAEGTLFLTAVRIASVEANQDGQDLGAWGNLVVLSYLVAIAMVYETDGTPARRWRAVLAVAVAAVCAVLSASKSNLLMLILTIYFVAWAKAGRFNLKGAIVIVTIMTIAFAGGLLMINWAGDTEAISAGGAEPVVRAVLNYAVGGLVAFSQSVDNPASVPPTQTLDRPFDELASHFGANVEIPGIHAEFVDISPFDRANQYTQYFTYFTGLGWVGMVTCLIILGFVTSLLYFYARRGGSIAIILLATICTALIRSIFGESLVLGLNMFLKTLLLLLFTYMLVPAVAGFFARMRTQQY